MSERDEKILEIKISKQEYDLLSAIDNPSTVIRRLVDHAAQGIRRTGAWETEWIRQCFGYDFEKNLEEDPISYGLHWTNMRTKGTKGSEK